MTASMTFTTADRIAHALCERIVHGVLMGGVALRQDHIAQEFSINNGAEAEPDYESKIKKSQAFKEPEAMAVCEWRKLLADHWKDSFYEGGPVAVL